MSDERLYGGRCPQCEGLAGACKHAAFAEGSLGDVLPPTPKGQPNYEAMWRHEIELKRRSVAAQKAHYESKLDRLTAKLEAAREKLKPIGTEHLVSLAQWLDRKFPEEKEADREVQDSLIKWTVTVVRRALLDTQPEEAK